MKEAELLFFLIENPAADYSVNHFRLQDLLGRAVIIFYERR